MNNMDILDQADFFNARIAQLRGVGSLIAHCESGEGVNWQNVGYLITDFSDQIEEVVGKLFEKVLKTERK